MTVMDIVATADSAGSLTPSACSINVMGVTSNVSKDCITEHGNTKNIENHSTETDKKHCNWRLPKRYIFSTLSFAASTLAVSLNTNISIAIVSMVNRNTSITTARPDNECMQTTEENDERKGPVVPVIFYLISRWIPVTERCFLGSIILAGYGTGSFITFVTGGALCATDFLGGWPSVFYFNGAVGLLWCVACCFLVFETPSEHPTISDAELFYINRGLETKEKKQIKTIPWKSMATSAPLWALAAGYFGQYWSLGFHFTVQAYYMGTIINLNSVKNGQLSSVPHLMRAVFACICSYPADWALKKGIVGVAFIRKGATVINSVVSIVGFVGIMLVECDPTLNTIFFTIGGLTGDFLLFGICMACIDIAPNLSGTVLGITNTIGTIPFFIIPTLVGLVTAYERTMAQWRWIYFITIGIITVCTFVFVIFGTLEPQPWGTFQEEDECQKRGTQESNDHELKQNSSTREQKGISS